MSLEFRIKADVEVGEMEHGYIIVDENHCHVEKMFVVVATCDEDRSTNLNLYKSRELAEERIRELIEEDGDGGFCSYGIDVLEVENKV